MNTDIPATRAPDHFPKVALWGAAALVIAAIAFAAAGRQQSTLTAQTPGAYDLARPTAVELGFLDRDDGGVAVLDGSSGAEIATLAPGTNGFVRGVMRGLARERRLHGLDHTRPFRLARWPDGHMTLEDTATGRLIELASFGTTNQAAFGALWAAARDAGAARRTTTLGGDDSHAEFSAAANH